MISTCCQSQYALDDEAQSLATSKDIMPKSLRAQAGLPTRGYRHHTPDDDGKTEWMHRKDGTKKGRCRQALCDNRLDRDWANSGHKKNWVDKGDKGVRYPCAYCEMMFCGAKAFNSHRCELDYVHVSGQTQDQRIAGAAAQNLVVMPKSSPYQMRKVEEEHAGAQTKMEGQFLVSSVEAEENMQYTKTKFRLSTATSAALPGAVGYQTTAQGYPPRSDAFLFHVDSIAASAEAAHVALDSAFSAALAMFNNNNHANVNASNPFGRHTIEPAYNQQYSYQTMTMQPFYYHDSGYVSYSTTPGDNGDFVAPCATCDPSSLTVSTMFDNARAFDNAGGFDSAGAFINLNPDAAGPTYQYDHHIGYPSNTMSGSSFFQ